MQKFKKIIKKISPLLQVLSFVVALVMIYSLKIDTDNLRIAQSTYFNSLRPTWNSQLTFAENNLDLISVEFNPVNEGILLQNLEITFPEGYIGTNPIKTYNNVWKCNILNSKITEQFYLNYYENKVGSEFLRQEMCYPVLIKFKYIHHGELKESVSVYKINFTVFNEQQVRIRSLEFLNSFVNDQVLAIDYLNKLSCVACLKTWECIDPQDWEAYAKSNKEFPALVENLNNALQLTVIQFVSDDVNNQKLKPENFTVPSFVANEDIQLKFIQNLAIIKEYKVENTATQLALNEMLEFIEKNQICKSGEYYCLQQSSWANDKLIEEWRLIVIGLMFQLTTSEMEKSLAIQ